MEESKLRSSASLVMERRWMDLKLQIDCMICDKVSPEFPSVLKDGERMEASADGA